MVAWNLEELRVKVRGRNDADDVLKVISSLSRSTEIFRYHLITARDALKGFVNETDANHSKTLAFLLGGHDRQDEFEYARVVSEANLIACIHTCRGIWDTFSQLVNVLSLPKPLPIGACDIKRVAAALSTSPLQSAINDLLCSHWFQYVAAFINTTKHRRLIEHTMTVSFEEDRAGVKFGAFTYGSTSFPQYWGREVLEGTVEVKNHVIKCGRYLNEVVAPAA